MKINKKNTLVTKKNRTFAIASSFVHRSSLQRTKQQIEDTTY